MNNNNYCILWSSVHKETDKIVIHFNEITIKKNISHSCVIVYIRIENTAFTYIEC